MEDGAGESEVRGLYHLGAPELEHRVDSEHNLKEREGFGSGVILKDMFTPDSEEQYELASVGKEVGAVESSVGEGGRYVRVLDGSEVPESPEVESRVRERGIWESKVPGGRVKGIGSGGAHCGARSKRQRR